MSAALNKRLSKVEEISARSEIDTELDRCLEKRGTSRAAMLADFGSLTAFRDWLAARIAATDDQAGFSIAMRYRQRQVDSAASEKWNAILDQHEVLQ